jgi:hypothetical protein
MPWDYSKGKQYALRSHLGDKVYIGSTIDTLPNRLNKHKADYRCGRGVRSIEMFEEYGIDNVYIELIELYPCSCKAELERREGQLQREYIGKGLAVNQRIAGRKPKDYYEEHKEKMDDYKKKWNEENRERRLKKQKEYDLEHKEERYKKIKCECGCEVSKHHLARHKETKKHIDLLNAKTI